jgi:hypothetical protein
VPRSLCLTAACSLALVFCAPGRGQDSPSLGDLARQAQKDKANKPQAKVITNEDMPSSFGGGLGRVGQPGSTGKPGEGLSPAESVERLQAVLDKLDTLDRAALVNNVLKGNNTNFPGRARWEEKMFAAKQTFVSQSREVLLQVRELMASAGGMKDVQDPNDPRAKAMAAKLMQLMQESQQASAKFQAMIEEGRDLAALPASQ